MSITKKSLISIFVLMFSYAKLTSAQSGNELMDKLALPLNKLSQNNNRAQVYIQLSKGSYESGEDLWFKSYLLNVLTHKPSTSSKTLYVQVVKEGINKAFWQQRYQISNGTVSGHVYLPDTLSEGNYRLEAFSKASFFKEEQEFTAFRTFRVVRDYKSLNTKVFELTRVSGTSAKKIQVGIFPEGGKLIWGVPGKLAVKAVDTKGIPLDFNGSLFEDGKVIREFKSVHAGMGSLEFTPIAEKNYALQIKTQKKDSILSLPAISATGYSLRLSSRDSSQLEFTLSRKAGLVQTKVYLRGQIRGRTCFLASALIDDHLKIKVPLSNFPYQGIAEFTVFDEQFVPSAERLVYLNFNRKLYISATLSKTSYAHREKGLVNIKTCDEQGNPVQAELGLSISDKLYGSNEPLNLQSFSFLSTQLKGRIYNPLFYFDENNPGREEALELLLLSQGWRNYSWNEERLKAEGLKASFIFDECFGTVKFTKGQKQAPPGQLVNSFLSDEAGKPKNSSTIIPGPAGNFYVSVATLSAGKGANIYLKPMGPETYEPRIVLTNPFLSIDSLLRHKTYSAPYAAVARSSIKEPPIGMESRIFRLREVSIKGSGIQAHRDKYLGRLDSLARIDPTAFVCKHRHLNGYFPAFYCANGPHGRCIDTLTASPREGETYSIVRYEPSSRPDIYDLKESTFATYHNANKRLTEEEILRLNNLTRLSGYYPQKEFYQPDYDQETGDEGIPDARNTLLWAPSVLTNEKGEASVSFFCSDISSLFLLQAEGFTKDGLLGTQQLQFSVVKGKAK